MVKKPYERNPKWFSQYRRVRTELISQFTKKDTILCSTDCKLCSLNAFLMECFRPDASWLSLGEIH